MVPVHGVNRVRRDHNQRHGSGQQFENLLKREQTKMRQMETERQEEELRRMGGMNQYNRQAVEIFFMFSSQMDYKC